MAGLLDWILPTDPRSKPDYRIPKAYTHYDGWAPPQPEIRGPHRPGAYSFPKTTGQRAQQVFGMDPKVRRLGLLPYPKGALGEGPIDWSDWTAPEILHSFAKGAVTPGHALKGGHWTPDDVTRDVGLNVAGLGYAAGGLLAPKGAALGMGGTRPGIGHNLGPPMVDEIGPVYQSRLKPAIEAMPQEKMTADQAAAHFRKYPGGVGADELEWSGIQGLLGAGGTVTKSGLLAQYEENPLEIEDVTRGGTDPEDYTALHEESARQDMDEFEIMFDPEEGGWVTSLYGEPMHDYGGVLRLHDTKEVAEQQLFDELVESAQQMPLEELLERTGGGPPGSGGFVKYADSSLNIPGGTNYRETLLTLPAKTGAATTTQRYEELTNIAARRNLTDAESEEMLAIERAEFSGEAGTAGQDYVDPHWPEKNVVAHARFDTRNIDGDRTLFLQEVQSKWHQQGKAEGYKTPDKRFAEPFQVIDATEGISAPSDYVLYEVRDANGEFITNVGSEIAGNADQAIVVARGRIRDNSAVRDDRVPDAPFKKNWPDLTFRRMIREAAETDHQRIAWTSGQMQIDRYDLSKLVDRVMWNESSQTLIAYDKAGSSVLFKSNVPAEKIGDHIGKEVAKKLVNAKYEKLSVAGAEDQKIKSISGMELKVGGEGKKAIYDRMLVKAANKFAKKYGEKVQVKEIDTGPEVYSITNKTTGNSLGGGYSKAEAKAKVVSDPDTYEMVLETGGPQEVWSLKITPEMRKAILKGGVALSGVGLLYSPKERQSQ